MYICHSEEVNQRLHQIHQMPKLPRLLLLLAVCSSGKVYDVIGDDDEVKIDLTTFLDDYVTCFHQNVRKNMSVVVHIQMSEIDRLLVEVKDPLERVVNGLYAQNGALSFGYTANMTGDYKFCFHARKRVRIRINFRAYNKEDRKKKWEETAAKMQLNASISGTLENITNNMYLARIFMTLNSKYTVTDHLLQQTNFAFVTKSPHFSCHPHLLRLATRLQPSSLKMPTPLFLLLLTLQIQLTPAPIIDGSNDVIISLKMDVDSNSCFYQTLKEQMSFYFYLDPSTSASVVGSVEAPDSSHFGTVIANGTVAYIMRDVTMSGDYKFCIEARTPTRTALTVAAFTPDDGFEDLSLFERLKVDANFTRALRKLQRNLRSVRNSIKTYNQVSFRDVSLQETNSDFVMKYVIAFCFTTVVVAFFQVMTIRRMFNIRDKRVCI
ncbi:hypothetical protein Q1695_010395 [Nippostrongylus brasiliensis]|nr:hypothetical protein Q1695_010395 [Nippostrongylus brasiliensis]